LTEAVAAWFEVNIGQSRTAPYVTIVWVSTHGLNPPTLFLRHCAHQPTLTARVILDAVVCAAAAAAAACCWPGPRRCGREQLLGRLQAAAAAGDRAALESAVQSYGRELISAVGAEVDRIEAEIQKLNPGAWMCAWNERAARGRHGCVGVATGGGGCAPPEPACFLSGWRGCAAAAESASAPCTCAREHQREGAVLEA
jgi:hypothetical protein